MTWTISRMTAALASTGLQSTGSRWVDLLRPAWAIRGLLAGLVAATLSFALFQAWDPGRTFAWGFQDSLHRLPQGSSREPDTLVVRLGNDPAESVAPLVTQLAAAAPRAIVFSGTPAELGMAVGAAQALPGIPFVAGLASAPSLDNPDQHDLLQPEPGAEIPWGLRVLSPPEKGIHRSHAWSVATSRGPVPTLEGRLASILHGRPPKGSTFMVDFRGLLNRIPSIDSARVLRGEVPETLGTGKVIWIGRIGSASVVTPIDGARQPASDLEFHAAAIHTALRGKGMKTLPLVLQFALLWVAGGLAYLALRRHDPLRALAAVGVGSAMQGLAAWALLASPGLAWPAILLAAAQAAGILVAQIDRYVELRDIIRLMVLDTGRHLPPSHSAPADEDLNATWQAVAALLEQYMQVRRSVFLTASMSAPQLTEAWCINCDFSEIMEQRRDFRRYPYAQALRVEGPYQPSVRPFLRSVEGEIQFLVPLLAYGEVEGFWALALPSEGNHRQIEAALKSFALQIAEMLYARRIRPQPSAQSLRNQYFSSLTIWAALRTLRRHTGELDRNYRMLDALFDHLSAPSMIFNLFGHGVRQNPAMTAFLLRHAIPGRDLTLTSLIQRMTGSDPGTIQEALRRLLLHRERQVFRVGGSRGQEIRLTLSPLALETGSGSVDHDAPPRPFGLEGLLLEVEGRARFQETDGLQSPGDPTGGKEPSDLITWAQELEREPLQVSGGSHQPGPVSPTPVFQGALKHAERLMAERGLTLEQTGEPSRILAHPRDLYQVFRSALLFIAEDARKGSVIQVRWHQDGRHQLLTLTSQGPGLPQASFHSLLERDSALTTESLRSLQSSRRLLETWQGGLEAGSDLGRGTWLSMSFLPAED